MKYLTVNSAKVAIKAGSNTLHIPQKIARVLAGPGDEDGEPRNAVFVSFPQLWCNVQENQILHDRAPFALKVTNVPLPIYIYFGIILVYLVKRSKLVLLLKMLYG